VYLGSRAWNARLIWQYNNISNMRVDALRTVEVIAIAKTMRTFSGDSGRSETTNLRESTELRWRQTR